MSIAYETNRDTDSNRIQSLGFRNSMWIHNLSESAKFTGANHWSNKLPAVKEEDSDTSSSIGNNSDDGVDSGEDDGEVQSKDDSPIAGFNDLEQALPIKRGISTFYAGKSKSYGSLTDAVSVSSIQDIVKQEDAYSRKRKNMLAHTVLLDKFRKSTTENGISKKLARHSNDKDENGESSNPRPGLSRPPLPAGICRRVLDKGLDSSPMYSSSCRSLSLSDLQQVSSINGFVNNKSDEGDEH
ncbi:uncharacterized protein [Rutidosis leptorrhynchoides]|uniref:uncharacterized protein n=1 Tax=Rutidosis leptorrhynchoides TaxID=125765 RepID=UPI003A99387C